MAGPNDYHVPSGSDGSELHPGLGKDEPTDEQRAGVRAASAAKMKAIREELAAQGAELNEREKALIAKEEAQIAKERELEKREKALEKATTKETAKDAKKSGATE